MKYLAEAVKLAESRGYLAYPEVIERSNRLPDWYRRLGTQAGIDALAAKIGRPIPEALVEYYSLPLLVSFLDFAVDGSLLFEHDAWATYIPLDRQPAHLIWNGVDYVALLTHNHSSLYYGASLDTADPNVACNFPWGPGFGDDSDSGEELDETQIFDVTFSEWIYSTVDAYESQLDSREALIRKVDSDPVERARIGSCAVFRALPGMSDRLEKHDD